MKLKLTAAILAGKIVSWLSRTRGHRGSSLPGLLARKVYSGALSDLALQVRKGIIVVSGTNGKTTTVNMTAGLLKDSGHKVIANREGANLIAGVTTAFVVNAGITGKIDCDYAVLEVDEASMPGVLEEINPMAVVLTNFFRDQLDRYWELDKTTGIICDSLRKHKQSMLILNADDPLVSQFKKTTGLPAIFYGLGRHKLSSKTSKQTREAKCCPFCGAALSYEYYHYSQLGRYRCPGCEFARPEPTVEAVDPVAADGFIGCRLYYDQREFPLVIQTRGIYNLYNALAAISAGLYLGADIRTILDSLSKYRPVVGRMERFKYKGRHVFLNLVKNPTGFNEGLAVLGSDGGTKDVFVAINDNDADGRDVSWLWDVDFESLGADHNSFLSFICSGKRGEEMALRLKYAGVPLEKISLYRDTRLALKTTLAGRADIAYLFTTYTVLWPVYKIIKNLSAKEGADD